MASKELKVHRLGLGRLVVEGNLQPIVRAATLTLKDEDHDKHIMQLHVDGETLAQWDLDMLRERKLTGVEKFFTIAEQRMLQLTLPLFEQGGEKVASIKTIQLFILNVKDFNTAVDYLSQGAGMQHCHINKVLQNLRGVSVPKLAPASKPQEFPGTSYMGPPLVPLMGRPMRPQSQTAVRAPVRYSPSQPVYRSHTARPNLTLVPGNSSQNSSSPGTAVPIRGRTPSMGDRYWSSPLVGPLDHRSSFVSTDSRHPRRLPSTGPGVGIFTERKPLYHHPLQYGAQRPPPSNYQVETGTRALPDEHYHDRSHGKPSSYLGRISPSAPRGEKTYPLEGRPLSRPSTARPASRPSPSSDRGVPIRIQVLSLPDQPNYSRLPPEIRWEFTLHLLPSTKIFELYLHVASYIRREYRETVDGRALAAQSMNGTIFEDQESLPDETLHGETLILVERRLFSTEQSTTVNSSGSYLQTLHPDWRPEAGKLDGSQPAFPRDPFHHAFDETDQVPPPRQLPSPLANTPAPPRSSSSIAVAHSPLSERPDLMNAGARSRPNTRGIQPVSQGVSTESSTKKQPKNSQKQPTTTSRRPVSSASRKNLEPVPGTAESSEHQTSARRPGTSHDSRRKRKAPPGDVGVSMVTPSAIGSLLSNDEVIAEELATTSCMGCRNKHRKCDRSKPVCGPCLKDKRPCTYPNIHIHKTAATGHSPDKASNRPYLDAVTHPMTFRNQGRASLLVVLDASTQTCHPKEYRNIGSQTQGIEHNHRDVEMKDMGTDPYNLYTDTSTETARCDDLWVPFSQCAQVVLWAGNQYERQIQKAAEILGTTEPSRDDYQEKVAQAAVYAWEFENGFREMFEQSLKS